MQVRISDLRQVPIKTYIANSVGDCASETEKSVFKAVIETGKSVTIDKIIGELYDNRKKFKGSKNL
jgi:hypothetical protein